MYSSTGTCMCVVLVLVSTFPIVVDTPALYGWPRYTHMGLNRVRSAGSKLASIRAAKCEDSLGQRNCQSLLLLHMLLLWEQAG